MSNRSPLFVWFARGPQLFRSTVEDLFPSVFVLRLYRRSISARVSSTSPDTSANVSRVIGIFETAVCHCRSFSLRYHPPTDPSVRIQLCLYMPTVCPPLYFLPPLFFSSSLFFLFSRSPISSSYKSFFYERERERKEEER